MLWRAPARNLQQKDTGAIPLSLLEFTHGSTSLTSRALWGGIVSRITFNFHGSYLMMDKPCGAAWIRNRQHGLLGVRHAGQGGIDHLVPHRTLQPDH